MLFIVWNGNELTTAYCGHDLDEWTNFLERIEVHPKDEKMDLTRHWVSYRGQTLSRTGLSDNDGFVVCPY